MTDRGRHGAEGDQQDDSSSTQDETRYSTTCVSHLLCHCLCPKILFPLASHIFQIIYDTVYSNAGECIITSASKRSIRRFVITPVPSLMIIASRTQFYVERPWGQHPFSIVS